MPATKRMSEAQYRSCLRHALQRMVERPTDSNASIAATSGLLDEQVARTRVVVQECIRMGLMPGPKVEFGQGVG